jgi:RNA polymerase sigma-70 factor (ECF subfamily)
VRRMVIALQVRMTLVPDPIGDFTDDAVLVPALRAGDADAFAWLLDRYSAPLSRLARSYVSNAAAADEAVQETWLAVITGLERFEQRSSLKTWLYRILANVARAKGVKEHRSIPFASLGPELDNDEPAVDPARFRGPAERWPGHWAAPPVPWDEIPEQRLLGGETITAVAHAIAALPPNQRAVITLRDVEGWDPDEVCNALELSDTNQRVLLHRARSKVRRALELHLEEAPG